MNLNIKQQEAIDKLGKLRAGALFMDMGTGKTKVALELAKGKEKDFDCIIWIAPASLINTENYQQEIEKWNNINKPIHFYTIEGVSQSDSKFLEMRSLAEIQRCFCIIDESINIKNIGAKRTKRLLEMWSIFDFRLILNGTPLTKGLIDLYSQIQFIHPNILRMSEVQFANNFLQYKKDGFASWRKWSKPANEEALIEILRPYIFDCELDIDKPIFYNDINTNLNEIEHSEYQQMKNVFLDNKIEPDFMGVSQYFQHCYTLTESKKNKVIEILNDLKQRGEKVIIYVKFLNEVEFLRNLQIDFLEYTGKNKQDIDEFKNSKNIMVCTYGVGSFGLNLQFANNIIYFSQTFDYKHKEQSLHRVYRTGQVKPVNIYNFWCDTGLERLIKASLDKKQSVLNNIKEIIENGGADKL